MADHLFQHDPGRLRFADLYGPTDDALVKCLPAGNVGRPGGGNPSSCIAVRKELRERIRLPVTR